MVLGALNNAASRYFLILCIFEVFFLMQSIAYSTWNIFSFKNLLLTNSAGYSLDATTMDLFLQRTVSRIRSKIFSSSSTLNGWFLNGCGLYWYQNRIRRNQCIDCHHTKARHTVDQDIIVSASYRIDIFPVSYTHLDVYKRQSAFLLVLSVQYFLTAD